MINPKIRILLFGSNLWYLGAGLLGPLFAVFAERIGGDILDITWAWAIYLLTTGVLIILIGRISDIRIKKQTLLMVGFALNTLLTFGYLLVNSPLRLFLVEAGLGVAAALANQTYDALFSLYEDRKREGYEWGLQDGGEQIFTAIGVIAGGFIVTYFSFQILFIIMGIVQSIATFYITKILCRRQ